MKVEVSINIKKRVNLNEKWSVNNYKQKVNLHNNYNK